MMALLLVIFWVSLIWMAGWIIIEALSNRSLAKSLETPLPEPKPDEVAWLDWRGKVIRGTQAEFDTYGTNAEFNSER